MRLVKDEKGNRYGRLAVLARAENDKLGRAMWTCVCDCGATVRVLGQRLRRLGGTRSCGCLHRDTLASVRRRGWDPRLWDGEHVSVEDLPEKW